jgi:hypothetical protein
MHGAPEVSVRSTPAYRGGVKSRRHRPETPVQNVTSAPVSVRDDSSERMHRYLFSMGVRTFCFVLAVVFITVVHWTIVGWVCIGAAAVLPYIAVVMANATRSRRIDQLGAVTPSGQPFIELEQRLGDVRRDTPPGTGDDHGAQHGAPHGRRP